MSKKKKHQTAKRRWWQKPLVDIIKTISATAVAIFFKNKVK